MHVRLEFLGNKHHNESGAFGNISLRFFLAHRSALALAPSSGRINRKLVLRGVLPCLLLGVVYTLQPHSTSTRILY